MSPRRIQRLRTRGWRMPENAAYVGRPTVFGNPFRVGAPHPLAGEPMSAATCTALYRYGVLAGIAAWDGGTASYFHDEQSDIYDAWERVAPHLRAVEIGQNLDRLRGRDLVCWCPLDQPCHADVLLEIANR